MDYTYTRLTIHKAPKPAQLTNLCRKLRECKLWSIQANKMRDLPNLETHGSYNIQHYYSQFQRALKDNVAGLRKDLKQLQDTSYQHSLTREVKGLDKFEAYEHSASRYISGETYLKLTKDIRAHIKRLRERRKEDTRSSHSYSDHIDTLKYIGTCVNVKPNSVLLAHKANVSKICYASKRPMTDEHHIGIEIETMLPNRNDSAWNNLANALIEAKLERNVQIKSDGSISEIDGYREVELAIVAPISQYEITLKQVCIILDQLGARVNKSCGLHVHLDARHRIAPQMLERLIKAQNLLFKIVPESRRVNTFCKKTATRTRLTSNVNRYHAVNGPNAYQKFRTIEVRLHSGTIDFEKINNWIRLLHTIINAEIEIQPRSIKGWIRELRLDDTLGAYVSARFEKFKDKNESDETLLPIIESLGEDETEDCEDDFITCEDCELTSNNYNVIYRSQLGGYYCDSCAETRETEQETEAR